MQIDPILQFEDKNEEKKCKLYRTHKKKKKKKNWWVRFKLLWELSLSFSFYFFFFLISSRNHKIIPREKINYEQSYLYTPNCPLTSYQKQQQQHTENHGLSYQSDKLIHRRPLTNPRIIQNAT